jgi:hypothetical protein
MMEKGKVLKMPKYLLEHKNNRGDMSVNCEITYRWLRFTDSYSDTKDGKVAFIDVMTTNIDGVDKKICGLAVSINELLKVINRIHRNE